jgi:hypothetical protein
MSYLALDPRRMGRGDIVVSQVSTVVQDLAASRPAAANHSDHLRRRIVRRVVRFVELRTFGEPDPAR